MLSKNISDGAPLAVALTLPSLEEERDFINDQILNLISQKEGIVNPDEQGVENCYACITNAASIVSSLQTGTRWG